MSVFWHPAQYDPDYEDGTQETEEEKENNVPIHCYHDWKLYVGIHKVYEYCTKCDKKKPEEDLYNKPIPKKEGEHYD